MQLFERSDKGDEIRVVHYLNQFFAGIGGEDKAYYPLTLKPGPVGPGKVLQERLCQAKVIATVICGDNWFHENDTSFAEKLESILREWSPAVVVAGPAFNAGRYGLACGRVCSIAQERLGIPSVTSMAIENPGVDLYRRKIYIVPCSETAVGMRSALVALAGLAVKLARGEKLGPSDEEGYLARGVRMNLKTDKPMSERAVEMLLAKVQGLPFKTELLRESFETVAAPRPLRDLKQSTIAIVSESGLVPKGNPDLLERTRSTKWFRYNIASVPGLRQGEWESVHGGYDTSAGNEDPNRLVPVDALHQLASREVIRQLHEWYYVTTGSGGNLQTMQRLGREISQQLLAAKVDGVLLTAT